MTLACQRAAIRSFALLVRAEIPRAATEAMRLAMGRWLVLALEFQVIGASTVVVAANARLLRLKKAPSGEVREEDVSDEPRQSESRNKRQ